MKREKALEADAMNSSNKLCHPTHDDEQQQHYSNTLQRSSSSNSAWQIYTNTYLVLVHRAAAYSMYIIYQVNLLC